MSYYPILHGKDRALAVKLQSVLRSVANRATDPKLKSSVTSWAMILRACTQPQRPRATK